MVGSNILVPILVGLPVSNALFSAGVSTIIFHFFCKRKVPVFLGSSFTFITSMQAIGQRLTESGKDTTSHLSAHIFIGSILAGVVYFIFAILCYYIGYMRVRKLFPPLVIGPIIMVIGLTLGPSVIQSNIVEYENQVAAWVTALSTTLTIVLVSLFGYSWLKTIPILLGIAVGYAVGACFGIVETDRITSAPWILFQPQAIKESFGWYKNIVWDSSAVVSIAPLAIVTLMEHFGDITTNSAIVGVNFFDDPGVHRTICADGIALVASALLGGPPITTYGENTGVLAITKQYNPKLLMTAGIIAVILGIFSKVGGILSAIPAPVIGGAAIVLFGMITSMGIKVLVDAEVKLIHTRNIIILSLILIIGVGFNESFSGLKISPGGVTISSLAICTVVGIIANLILPQPSDGEVKPTSPSTDSFDEEVAVHDENLNESSGEHV